MLEFNVTSPGDWTGVVQVVVAICGFFAAIWVPWWQRRNELKLRRNDAMRSARALAFQLRPILERWRARIDETNEACRDSLPNDAVRQFLGAIVRSKPLVVPQQLVSKIDDLYVLGWVADHIFEAMNAAHEGHALAVTVDEQEFDPDQSAPAQLASETVREKLLYTQSQVELALDEIVEVTGADGANRLMKLVNSTKTIA